MELQIQDLVTSIRKEGVEAAKAEAEKIITKAKEEAKAIIDDAKAQAEKTVEDASKEISVLRQSARVSAEQAKRDAMLSLRKEVQDTYGQLLKKEVSKAVSDEKLLASLISAAVEGQDASALTAEVSKVSDKLKTELSALLKKGLVLKPVRDLEAGFRLVSNDGSGYLDCSDEELSAIVAHFMGDINI